MKKILSTLLIVWSLSLTAGLPPTTSKVSGDTTDIGTFKFQFPNFTGTHTGSILSLGVNSIAGGGTGASTKAAAFDALSPMTTVGDIIYGGTAGTGTRLAAGAAGQFLKSNGAAAPSWATAAAAITPTRQVFTTGTGTYTTPANVVYLRVRMIGGGMGAGGGGTVATVTNGNAGTASTFGTSLLTANGATGSCTGSSGGSATISAPAYGIAVTGATGVGFVALNNVSASSFCTGGSGGSMIFGGNGQGGANTSGTNAIANSGAGGGGGGCGANSTLSYGCSGGATGGYIDAIIPTPSATYSYTVGTGGAGTAGGTGGFAGGNGGSGYIEVMEYY